MRVIRLAGFVGIGIDVEAGAEDGDVLAGGFDMERLGRVLGDFEVGFTGNGHVTGGAAEGCRIGDR